MRARRRARPAPRARVWAAPPEVAEVEAGAAADVVCCEKEELLANLSAELIPVNGFREEVRIAPTLSTNLTADMLGWGSGIGSHGSSGSGGGEAGAAAAAAAEEELEAAGADIVVTEIFGDAPLSESVLPSMQHAVQSLLKQQQQKQQQAMPRVVPCGFRVVAALAVAPDWLPRQATLLTAEEQEEIAEWELGEEHAAEEEEEAARSDGSGCSGNGGNGGEAGGDSVFFGDELAVLALLVSLDGAGMYKTGRLASAIAQ